MKLLLITQTRNKKDQVARTEQSLTGDTIRIGRGSDCKLHLPDPRVALHHAVLRGSETGGFFIEAEDGSFSVDGSFDRTAKLRTGQKILLGPYELTVAAPPAGQDVALTLELKEPLKEASEEIGRHVGSGLNKTWLSKRLLSWVGFLSILAVFLIWPVLNALSPETRTAHAKSSALTADASWDVGPLSSAHASFGSDCGKCHQKPFVQVTNEACESCHQNIGWHFPLDTAKAKEIHKAVFTPESEYRCASCHKDHKGVNGLVRSDATLCTDCHATLKTRHPQTASPDISDFQKNHPTFKLSMLLPGKKGSDALVRVPQDGKLKENSGLKFPHDVHLSKKGIRGPDGKVTMECKNCHTPDESGTRFKATNMKDHCQQCHSLEFEPKVTNRQVPHGNVEGALSTLREFYAQAALADTPIDVVVDAGIRRPGERISESKRQAALQWATEKADKIANDMFEDRVCFICHQITPVPATAEKSKSWDIAPIAITQHWLPKSRFPHNQHNTFECAKCHKVENSKVSADIAIPDLKSCQDCHGGNEATKDKARGTCETCHGFHTGSHRSGVPVIVPGGMVPKPVGKAGITKPDAGSKPAAASEAKQ